MSGYKKEMFSTGLVEIFWVSNYKVNDRMILNI